jgi:hypothetical protein
MSPSQLLDRVHDRDSFFDFISALSNERRTDAREERENPSSPYGPTGRGWENTTIGDFLGAALRWAKTTQMGQTQGLGGEPSWKAFAVFLYVGKIYE